jgi:hypothetical protein
MSPADALAQYEVWFHAFVNARPIDLAGLPGPVEKILGSFQTMIEKAQGCLIAAQQCPCVPCVQVVEQVMHGLQDADMRVHALVMRVADPKDFQ